jgi:predicted nucleotidyltransferase
MWKEGSIKVHESVFHYWIKVFEENSEFGIEGGMISKLMLKRDGKVVCNYDRGWDMKPTDPDTQLAYEIIVHSENY